MGHTWAKFFCSGTPHIRVHKAMNLSKAWAMAANEPNIKNGSKSMLKSYRNFILSPQSASGLGMKQVCRQCRRRRSTWAKSMSLCTALSVQTRGNIDSAQFCKYCRPCMPSIGNTQIAAGAGKLV